MITSTYIRFNRLVTAFIGGIPAGICVSVGGAAYLSTDNRYIGALLFSVGLLAIITYNFSLYTGKVGLSFGKDAFFILELAAMWVGNLAGTMLFAGLLRGTRVGAEISTKAAALALSKTSAPLPELFCLGAGCGICMYIAVTWSGKTAIPPRGMPYLSRCRSRSSFFPDTSTVSRICSIFWQPGLSTRKPSPYCSPLRSETPSGRF